MACPLCLEIQGEPHQHHAAYGRLIESGDHVLYHNDGMYCVPSLGPLNAYHLLVVPMPHYSSVAAIRDTTLRTELNFIKTHICNYNRLHFNLGTAFFEHGTGTAADVACACIEHAHVHALGTNVDLLELLREHYNFSELHEGEVAGNSELAASGYYYYEHSSSQAVVCTQMLEPQFFRIMFWRSFRQWAPWNWRLHYNLPLIQDVVANYRQLEEKCLTRR